MPDKLGSLHLIAIKIGKNIFGMTYHLKKER